VPARAWGFKSDGAVHVAKETRIDTGIHSDDSATVPRLSHRWGLGLSRGPSWSQPCDCEKTRSAWMTTDGAGCPWWLWMFQMGLITRRSTKVS